MSFPSSTTSRLRAMRGRLKSLRGLEPERQGLDCRMFATFTRQRSTLNHTCCVLAGVVQPGSGQTVLTRIQHTVAIIYIYVYSTL